MRDVTNTSFGLLIAFLLPGMCALISLCFWSAQAREVFRTFLTAQSNVGLFLLVVSAGLAAGLLVAAARWLLFECWWCSSERLRPQDFATLGQKEKLEAFGAAVDAHYRYHQFWGGMAIVLPLLYAGLLRSAYTASEEAWKVVGYSVAFLALEGLTVAAAIAAYCYYVARAKKILTGGVTCRTDGEGNQ